MGFRVELGVEGSCLRESASCAHARTEVAEVKGMEKAGASNFARVLSGFGGFLGLAGAGLGSILSSGAEVRYRPGLFETRVPEGRIYWRGSRNEVNRHQHSCQQAS